MGLYEKYTNKQEERKITIRKVKEHVRPASWEKVRVKEMGDIVELRYISDLNKDSLGGIVKKLNKDEYYNTITGEICRYKHTQRRIENKSSIRKSFQRLKEIINCNVTKENRKNCLFVTLTYRDAEHSLKKSQCYKDYKLYNMRFQNYLSSKGFEKAEYICVMEPQSRIVKKGKEEYCVFHFHIVYVFPSTRPYIPNSDIERLWSWGYTATRAVKADNLGEYLCAYLTNTQVADSSNPNNKKVIKNGRLKYYLSGSRLYRLSRRN